MKRFYRVLCAVSLLLLALCVPFALYMTTWRFGVCFFAALSVCTFLMGKLIDARDTRTDWTGKTAGWLVRVGHAVFLCWVCSFVVIEGMILTGGQTDVREPVEVICVLGGGLRGDQPSQNLKNRLEKAQEIWEAHPDAVLIVCGGQGADEAYPEAVVMKNWLTENGVPEDRILLEQESHNTVQNLENALDICTENALDSGNLTVVSSRFHLLRVRHILQSMGLTPSVAGAPAGSAGSRELMYLREYFSVVKQMVIGGW